MRVIAGEAKGRKLKVPTGVYVRPATELVRGAIFAMLEGLTDDWSQVLDLYSGSGSLGIEALSRGAGWVDFVDQEPRCCAIIKQNLETTRMSERASTHCLSVTRAIASLDKEYSIVLMDPPYANMEIGGVIRQLAGSGRLRPGAVVVVTHSPRLTLDPAYDGLKITKERRHGDSFISIYRKEAQP